MANNVISGPNAMIALVDVADISTLPLTPDNTIQLFECAGTYKVWIPGNPINNFNNLVRNRGYLLIAREGMDLSAYFAPDLPTGGGGNVPSVNAGVDQNLPSNATSANLSGTATPVSGTTIASRLWITVIKPDGRPDPIFADKTLPITEVTGLFPGTYVFQFQATDSEGNTGVDQMYIIVAAPDTIIVSAGGPQELDAGSTRGNLHGTATTSGETTIVGIEWSVVTPGFPLIQFTRQGELDTGVTNLPHPGIVTFRLSITDNIGRVFTADTTIEVYTDPQMFIITGWDPTNPTMRAYVALPQGYKDDRPGGYIGGFFMHGVGVNGDVTGDDVTQLLKQQEGLPYFLWNRLFPMDGIVWIAPQIHSGVWTKEQAKAAQAYLTTHYNVNSAIDPTGLSSGGGGTMQISLEENTLFSAGFPCNMVQNDVAIPGNGAIVKDQPFFMIHSYNDNQVPFHLAESTYNTWKSIIDANPQGIYPPMLLLDWEGQHNWTTWNMMLYDERNAPISLQKLMKKYDKNLNKTAENFVKDAETQQTFISYSEALVLVNKIPSSTTKTGLLSRLNAVKSAITAGKKTYMLNLGGTSAFNLYGINNIPSAADNATVNNLVDIYGVTGPLSFKVVTNPGGIATDGMNHTFMGMDNAMFTTSFKYTVGNNAHWQISGANPAKFYDLYFYCSTPELSAYTANHFPGSLINVNDRFVQSRLEGFNCMFLTTHYAVPPTAGGILDIKVEPHERFSGGTNVNAKYQGRTVAILVVERDDEPAREVCGQWNLCKTSNATVADWATVAGNPKNGTVMGIDPVSGFSLETLETSDDYWWPTFGSFGNDDEIPSGTAAWPGILPDKVGRSTFLNYNRNQVNVIWTEPQPIVPAKYNWKISKPGLGLPAGRYIVEIFCGSTQYGDAPSDFVVKIGGVSGKQHETVNVADHRLDRYMTFEGTCKEGDEILIGMFQPENKGSITFMNAVRVKKVR